MWSEYDEMEQFVIYLSVSGSVELDQVLTALLTTAMLVGGFTGCMLDNTVPGKTVKHYSYMMPFYLINHYAARIVYLRHICLSYIFKFVSLFRTFQ